MNTSDYRRALGHEITLALEKYSESVLKKENPVQVETKHFSLLCLIVNVGMAISKILFGAVYIHDCPTNHFIPIYCLVGGLLQLACIATIYWKPLQITCIRILCTLTYFIWFLVASTQTIIEFQPDYFVGGWRYCKRPIFYFAFGISITEVIIISLVFWLFCIRFAFE